MYLSWKQYWVQDNEFSNTASYDHHLRDKDCLKFEEMAAEMHDPALYERPGNCKGQICDV